MHETFYIVNGIDRPHERLVAEKKGDLVYYIHEDLRDQYKECGFDVKNRGTPIEQFGFDIQLTGENEAIFIKIRPSTAVYGDGNPRDWQGSSTFKLKRL